MVKQFFPSAHLFSDPAHTGRYLFRPVGYWLLSQLLFASLFFTLSVFGVSLTHAFAAALAAALLLITYLHYRQFRGAWRSADLTACQYLAQLKGGAAFLARADLVIGRLFPGSSWALEVTYYEEGDSHLWVKIETEQEVEEALDNLDELISWARNDSLLLAWEIGFLLDWGEREA